MVTSLLSGIVIGFILAIPPGPIAMAVMKAGLQNDGRKGMGIGIGAALMDVLYCMLATLATISVAGQTSAFIDNNPTLMLVLQIGCVVAMIIYGIVSLRTKRTETREEPKPRSISKLIEQLGNKGPVFIGIAISLTNLANPTFLPSLTAMPLLAYKAKLIDTSISQQLLFSTGFGIGMMGWIVLLLRTILRYRSRMSPRFIDTLHRFAGLTFIGFGTYIGYRAFSVIKWPEIIRLVLSF